MDTRSVAPPRPRTAARARVPQPRRSGGRVAAGSVPGARVANSSATGDGRPRGARSTTAAGSSVITDRPGGDWAGGGRADGGRAGGGRAGGAGGRRRATAGVTRPDPMVVAGGPARARGAAPAGNRPGARDGSGTRDGSAGGGSARAGSAGSDAARRYRATGGGASSTGSGTRHRDAGVRIGPAVRARSAVRAHPATGVQLPAIPFVLIVLGLLGGGLVCLLVVNTTLGATSFRISQLQSAHAKLVLREQTLVGRVADAESPQRIAQRAYQLGMRPQTDGQILNLPAGKFDQVPNHPGAQGLDSAIGLAPSASSTPTPASTSVAKSADTTSAGTGKAHHKPAERATGKRHRHKAAARAGSGR
jgi:hypothetical protein